MRRRAFTLVELLVVIGIIAILLGIFLPILGKVRRQARSTTCVTNLRSLGQGFQVYVNNNHGCLPPGRTSEGVFLIAGYQRYRPRWYDLVGGAMDKPPIAQSITVDDDTWQITDPLFLCPDQPEWTNGRNYAFGYNYQFLGNTRAKTDAVTGKKGFVNYPVQASRMKAASQTVMAADSMGTAARLRKDKRKAYRADGTHEADAIGNKGWSLDPPRLTDTSDYTEYKERYRTAPDPRHDGKANVIFVDGHVEPMTLVDMGYVVKKHGQVPTADVGAHNRMFSGTGKDDDPPSAK